MGWKEWPSWVKGIIVALLLYIILLPLVMLSELIETIYSIIGYPINFIIEEFFQNLEGIYISSSVGNFIMVIVYGALIGWIIGKIKSRNEN